MTDKSSFVTKLAGFAAANGIPAWLGWLDIQVTQYDKSVDPTLPGFSGPNIYVFWHEYLSLPISIWCNRGIKCSLLVSKHRDADVLCRAAYHLGFDTVRGSTNRGGEKAIRELQRCGSTTNIAITPDGPQGPRRRMSVGPLFLSSKLQIPIVPMGIGFQSPWRLGTWDRFAIPKPFSRARLIGGPPMLIPSNINRDELQHHRQQVEDVLNLLGDEAEAWATNGDRRIDQRSPTLRLPGPINPSSQRSKRLDIVADEPAHRVTIKEAA